VLLFDATRNSASIAPDDYLILNWNRHEGNGYVL
jgi:hypothetical protein